MAHTVLKIAFFGSCDVACVSLERLARNPRVSIVAAITRPDPCRGRGLKKEPQPVRECAVRLSIPVLQPARFDKDFYAQLRTISAGLFVVVNFGTIFAREFFDIPRLYAVNLHFSLLPRYRGASPVNWAIINGETHTGATVFKISSALDAGDIIASRRVAIGTQETAGALLERLSIVGAGLLGEVVTAIACEDAALRFKKQDERAMSYAPKLKKSDGLIRWDEPAAIIANKVRGFIPWPGAFTYHKECRVKLWKAHVLSTPPRTRPAAPGTIVEASHERGIVVQTKKDCLVIESLQPESKKIMTASQYISGYGLVEGMSFGAKQ